MHYDLNPLQTPLDFFGAVFFLIGQLLLSTSNTAINGFLVQVVVSEDVYRFSCLES